MGRYRLEDLFNAPTLISLARIPLAAAFPFVRESVPQSLLVLGLAGVSDVVDGWIARRYALTTPTGAVVDGITDKLFAATVLVTLVWARAMPLSDLALLGSREIGELPLVVWLALSPAARRRKMDDRANVFGKAATALQFATVVSTMVGSDLRTPMLWSTAIVGGAAAVSYWRRALVATRRAPR